MITKLTQGCWKILEYFYINKDKAIHLREIARATGLHLPAASMALKTLEKGIILQAKKDANLKRYSLKKSKAAFSILSLFDSEKLDTLPDRRKNAIKYYLDKLPEKPVFALLFGSTAKGNFKDESDIDILIITNKKIDTKNARSEADALTGIKVNDFQMEYELFIDELKLKRDPVIQSAINSGFPIFNNIFFYEVLADERA